MMEASVADLRDGEMVEKTRRRQYWTVVAALFAAGLVVGFVMALAEGEGDFLIARLPPIVAVTLAAVTFLAMTIGTWAYCKRSDEVDIHANLWGAATGASALMVAYPVWIILWKGGLLDEPHHLSLFVLTSVATLAGYAWKKYR